MAGLNGESLTILAYDTENFDFMAPVADALGRQDLEKLHEDLGRQDVFRRETDQHTEAHRRFYAHAGPDSVFGRTYRHFIHQFVESFVEESVIYQTVPTFRVHLPGNRAVGEFHRDTDYAHNPEAITWWLPLTSAAASNALHIIRNGRPEPVAVSYGEVLAFDSMNLEHGNLLNLTGKTRVSFDFRTIPASVYEPSDARSVNTGALMRVGEYYDER